jgi:hypothetical protein
MRWCADGAGPSQRQPLKLSSRGLLGGQVKEQLFQPGAVGPAEVLERNAARESGVADLSPGSASTRNPPSSEA